MNLNKRMNLRQKDRVVFLNKINMNYVKIVAIFKRLYGLNYNVKNMVIFYHKLLPGNFATHKN